MNDRSYFTPMYEEVMCGAARPSGMFLAISLLALSTFFAVVLYVDTAPPKDPHDVEIVPEFVTHIGLQNRAGA